MNKNNKKSSAHWLCILSFAVAFTLIATTNTVVASESDVSDPSQDVVKDEDNEQEGSQRSLYPIKGAFGVEIGQSRDSIIDYARRRVQDRLYVYEATQPDPNFSRYLVMFDENNDKVISVTGLGLFEGNTSRQCEQRFVIYKSALERKHGVGETQDRSEKRKEFILQNMTATRKIFLIKEFENDSCALQLIVTQAE